MNADPAAASEQRPCVSLRYDYYGASDCGEKRHASDVMRALGIAYEGTQNHPMADQIWFMNCRNVPESLPSFITVLALRRS